MLSGRSTNYIYEAVLYGEMELDKSEKQIMARNH